MYTERCRCLWSVLQGSVIAYKNNNKAKQATTFVTFVSQ